MLLRLDRPVITTLLDEDKYNFHMGNAYHLKFPNAIGRYAYACRDRGVDFSPIYPELKRQIDYLGDLRFTTDECDWLLGNTECSEQYVSYLYNKQILDPRNVDMNLYGDGSMYVSYQGKLDLEAHREVKLLAIISELKFAHQYHGQHDAIDAALNEWVDSEIDWITNHAHPKFAFFEAGGRRRFSKKRQERVLVRLWNNLPKDENGKPKFIMGTSNCMLGKKYNIPTFGTVAHQWYMFFQTVTHPSMSMIRAMDVWREVYNGKLSIALTDTLGNEKWDRDFTKKYQEEHDGPPDVQPPRVRLALPERPPPVSGAVRSLRRMRRTHGAGDRLAAAAAQKDRFRPVRPQPALSILGQHQDLRLLPRGSQARDLRLPEMRRAQVHRTPTLRPEA
jgi:nicotinate phosphoribosyltransferase